MNGATMLAAVTAAAANVLGAAAIAWRSRRGARALDGILALSAGFMMAVVLVELVPTALAQTGPAAGGAMLVGFVLVHLTQHTLTAHFHFGEETHAVSTAVSMAALVGLLLHTFVDGVAIASGYLVSQSLGTLVFLAIMLHKIPEGLAIGSMFLAAGWSRRYAVLSGAALGAATLVGALLTGWVRPIAHWGLPLAAGVTLYVAASNLVPEFQSKGGWRSATWFVGGCVLFLLAYRMVA